MPLRTAASLLVAAAALAWSVEAAADPPPEARASRAGIEVGAAHVGGRGSEVDERDKNVDNGRLSHMKSSLDSGIRRGLLLVSLAGAGAMSTACIQTVFVGGGGGEGGSGEGENAGGAGAGTGAQGGGPTTIDLGCDPTCPAGPCDANGACQLETVETCAQGETCGRGECLESTCRCVMTIAASEGAVCAVLADGSVWCMGRNEGGQVGDGTTLATGNAFAKALAPPAAAGVATNGMFTCALHQDKSVSCWGVNHNHQVSPSSALNEPLPVAVPPIGAGAAHVTVGYHHACAIDVQGKLFCWGNNGGGQAGNDTGGSVLVPSEAVTVTPLGTVVGVDAAGNYTCALIADGTVWCFGDNDKAPIGDGLVKGIHTFPVKAVGLDQAVEISVGLRATCARRADGSVWCWGLNLDPMPDPTALPAPVPELSGAVEIGVGRNHVCARKADGTVWCRGQNGYGEVGVDPPSVWEPATQVAGLPGPAVELSVEDILSCARLSDDSVWCWGAMDQGVDSPTPVKLPVPCP